MRRTMTSKNRPYTEILKHFTCKEIMHLVNIIFRKLKKMLDLSLLFLQSKYEVKCDGLLLYDVF